MFYKFIKILSCFRWEVVTFPVDLHPAQVYKPGQHHGSSENNQVLLFSQEDLVTVNCTVAYLDQCTGKSKCKNSCQTMGASAAKWFEDGCCECIGYNCINYGINESRCSKCSREDDEEEEGVELEDLSDEELAMLERDLEDELYSDDSDNEE